MVVYEIGQTTNYVLLNCEYFCWTENLLQWSHVLLLISYQIFFLDKLRYQLFQEIRTEKRCFLFIRFSQLNVVLFQHRPEERENISRPCHIILLNLSDFLQTERGYPLINFLLIDLNQRFNQAFEIFQWILIGSSPKGVHERLIKQTLIPHYHKLFILLAVSGVLFFCHLASMKLAKNINNVVPLFH